MAISMIQSTRSVLGENAENCTSRSLFKDRFADPQAEQDERKDWFNRLIKRDAETITSTDWLPPNAEVIHARLMSRMMVDLASGVMENANLNLDRYGLPVIPGSAIKGLARRMALQALHDWTGALASAGQQDFEVNDACAPCCQDFKTPAEMLAAIARIFGWAPEDWKTDKKNGHFKSDFAWACGGGLQPPSQESIENLLTATRVLLPSHVTFAGTIAFLPASPNRDPKLELDVVTPHHTKYHSGESGYETAPDTEDPIPVFFPAVKPQTGDDHFTFPLIPLRRADPSDLAFARLWLAHGLELFGIGTKTAAGYGWFDASRHFNEQVTKALDEANKREIIVRQRLEQEAATRAANEEQLRKRRELENALADLPPDQQEDKKFEMLSDTQFDGKVRAFCKPKGGPSAAEKGAIIRALKGNRLSYWQSFKPLATKGDLAKIDQAIRCFNKQLNGDKMP